MISELETPGASGGWLYRRILECARICWFRVEGSGLVPRGHVPKKQKKKNRIQALS